MTGFGHFLYMIDRLWTFPTDDLQVVVIYYRCWQAVDISCGWLKGSAWFLCVLKSCRSVLCMVDRLWVFPVNDWQDVDISYGRVTDCGLVLWTSDRVGMCLLWMIDSLWPWPVVDWQAFGITYEWLTGSEISYERLTGCGCFHWMTDRL